MIFPSQGVWEKSAPTWFINLKRLFVRCQSFIEILFPTLFAVGSKLLENECLFPLTSSVNDLRPSRHQFHGRSRALWSSTLPYNWKKTPKTNPIEIMNICNIRMIVPNFLHLIQRKCSCCISQRCANRLATGLLHSTTGTRHHCLICTRTKEKPRSLKCLVILTGFIHFNCCSFQEMQNYWNKIICGMGFHYLKFHKKSLFLQDIMKL